MGQPVALGVKVASDPVHDLLEVFKRERPEAPSQFMRGVLQRCRVFSNRIQGRIKAAGV